MSPQGPAATGENTKGNEKAFPNQRPSGQPPGGRGCAPSPGGKNKALGGPRAKLRIMGLEEAIRSPRLR